MYTAPSLTLAFMQDGPPLVIPCLGATAVVRLLKVPGARSRQGRLGKSIMRR